jgi:hypothetical protein
MARKSNHNIRIGDIDLDKEIVIVNGERLTEADALAISDELAGRAHCSGEERPGR